MTTPLPRSLVQPVAIQFRAKCAPTARGLLHILPPHRPPRPPSQTPHRLNRPSQTAPGPVPGKMCTHRPQSTAHSASSPPPTTSQPNPAPALPSVSVSPQTSSGQNVHPPPAAYCTFRLLTAPHDLPTQPRTGSTARLRLPPDQFRAKCAPTARSLLHIPPPHRPPRPPSQTPHRLNRPSQTAPGPVPGKMCTHRPRSTAHSASRRPPRPPSRTPRRLNRPSQPAPRPVPGKMCTDRPRPAAHSASSPLPETCQPAPRTE